MKSTTPSGRIEYLDIAKGIGIILVVLGHCVPIPEIVKQFVFSVHMPLFFILSGYTFKVPAKEETGPFVKKNAKALLLPYVLTCLIVIVVQVLLALIRHGDPLHELVKWAVSGLYASGSDLPAFFETAGIPVTFIGAIWFLPALFFARLIFFLCSKSRTPGLWILISFFAGYVSSRQIGWFPFSIQAGMCAVGFLYVGYLIRQRDLFRWNAVHWCVKLLMLGIWVYCIIFCGHLFMVCNMYTDGFLDIIGGICGTFVIIYISQGIEKLGRFPTGFFSTLGRCSLGIMCGHLIVLDCVKIDVRAVSIMELLHIPYMFCEVIVIFLGTAIVSAVLFVIPWVGEVMYPMKRKKRARL